LRRINSRRKRSSSISTPPMILCTAVRKAASSTLLRLLVLSAALCVSRRLAAGSQAAHREHRRLGRCGGGNRPHCRAGSQALAWRAYPAESRFGLCPRGFDGVGARQTVSTTSSAWRRTSGWRGRLRRTHQNPLRLHLWSARGANEEWRYGEKRAVPEPFLENSGGITARMRRRRLFWVEK
jgi:hypothetical protein